jgi:tripartite-type tricarboxylate transporter receptor subunit TctC
MRPPIRLLALAFALTCVPVAKAETYPERPIRLIVPFAAGGTVDIVARIVGAKLSEIAGSKVVVDNRGGAGGVIGTEMVVQAPGDGYTLLIHSGSITYDPSLHDKLPYDTMKDLAPITMIGTTPNLLVVAPSFPARSASDVERPASAGDIEPDAVARTARRPDHRRDRVAWLRICRMVRRLRSRDNSARAGCAHGDLAARSR